MVSEINEGQFSQVISDSAVSVVIVEKTQCPHCLKTLAGVETIIDKYEGKASFYRINLTEAGSLIDKYQIMAAPTLLFFKEGNLVKSRSGYTHPLVIEDILGGIK